MKRVESVISKTDISTRKRSQHLRLSERRERSSKEITSRMGQNSIKYSKKTTIKKKRKSQRVS